MAKAFVRQDFITPIKSILADKSVNQQGKLHNLIHSKRRILKTQFYNRFTVDQMVDKLIEPEWAARVKSFDKGEWEEIAADVWKKGKRIHRNAPRPELVLYPGFNNRNGQVYRVDRRLSIVCSPDFPHSSGDNLKVLIAHEYAHFVRWHKTGVPSESGPIYSYLFEEGWATWLSTKLYPDLSLGQCFMSNLHRSIGRPDPKGGYLAWCRQNLSFLAGEARKRLKTTGSKYRGQFFQGMRFKGEDTPIRTGYYLGYRIIEMLAKKMTVVELAYLRPTYQRVLGWLEELGN